ncbi:LLM class flavin-dependent oxidoreductase [Arthrobacter sulfonylureivorans]|uniref:LLM class flavin-dependent oxidoreductase n=1 Tax=Arthrobacter sulfonylureivorans TaxID=2486855 RepID=A0ABY3W5T3_9MICC|nr:LLM class flavin-dependent oxidoreductase [Arthrobacter sulfonylureivorans]UNK45598.1 LLM class flavin-dependent oxidoreductase [Arthrobacter sulfonylureivorans]
MTATNPQPFRLGFLAFVGHSGIGGGRSRGLDEGLELFELAEELGYDVGYVRHRHLEHYVSAPLPFLTAAAQRTSRIRVGTSVTPIRFEDPVRLAEEAGTVDLLTGGRLELGLSSGYSNNEGTFSQAYGSIDGSLRAVVDERVQRFLHAVEGRTVAVADEQVPFAKAGTGLSVQPVSPGLRGRIAYGAGSLASAERTGRQGLGLQLSTLNTEVTALSFEEAQQACIEAYRAEHAKASGWRSHASVSRQIAPYTNAKEQAELQWLLDRDAQRQGGNSDLPFQFGRVAAGSGEQVAAALAADVALAAADELVIALPFDYPASVVRRILTVAARDIAPALGWQPADREALGRELSQEA